MKRIHVVNPYGSIAMTRMVLPLTLNLPRLYVVSEGKAPDEDADLNIHIPYHTMTGYERTGRSKHVVAYTHCNPPDVHKLLDACERADATTCMTFAGRRELVEMGADPAKLHVIYSATDQFAYRRQNIGIVGFVQPNGRKREGILLDLAWNYDLTPFHLVIVGQGWGPTVNALRGMGVSVEWVDFLNDEEMRKFYHAINILLVTGYIEGGPLPLLEAMSAGCDVLSPAFGYAADLLEPEYLYADADELMDRLDGYIAKSILHHNLARAWTWKDYTVEHALLFGRLLGESVDLYPERGMSRYAQLLDVIDEHRPAAIVEIGTWNGNRAIQMIQQAAKYRPITDIRYQGFDLFEMQTGEQFRREFSKRGYPLAVVRKRIEATGADVQLVAGDTNTFDGLTQPADLYFIDGGHSEGTIRNDWALVERSMMSNSVVVFDDYYHPAADGIGCNAIIDELDRDRYEVTHLPKRTPSHDGKSIGMVKVRLNNADIRVQGRERTPYRENYTYLPIGNDPGSLRVVSAGDVARPADSSRELERPSAAP